MNLWLLTSEYPPDYGGGISTYCTQTAQMLCERGHLITVFVPSKNVPGKWVIEETSERLRVVRFASDQSPQSGALGTFARLSYDASLVVREFCRQEGSPDVLEVQEYLGLPYFTLQRRYTLDEALQNLPVLVTTHTPLFICDRYDQFPAYRFPGYWLGEMERFSLLAADGVIFPSRYLLNELEGELPQLKEHSRVIPNPYFSPNDLNISLSKQNRHGFLVTAKVERRKGIEPLLSAFKKLWDSGIDEPLFIIGDDWFDELHQRWTGEHIANRYYRYIEQGLLLRLGKQPPLAVKEKLNEVRAVILPSLFENFPYAVLEAMSAGCPAIVSQSGGHAEIVEDGVSGYVFSHQRDGDLEAKVRSVLELSPDEFEQMGTAAQQRVHQVAGYDAVAPQKEAALEWVRERLVQRKYFPFIRSHQRVISPPETQSPTREASLLSIVIPFYNLGAYLEDTLSPFSNLKDIPFEIIVVDDGSTDPDSIEALEKLQKCYDFRLERTENQGLAKARNTGARLARGEYLAFLDADDAMDVRFYPRAVEILRRYKNVSFVGCWAEYFGETQDYWPTWNPEPPYALVHNPINTSALIYRREDFLRYGLNDPSFAYVMEDYDSLLSMLENGCRGVSIPEPYFKYRVRGVSMFHKAAENVKVLAYQQLAEKHTGLYREYADDVVGLINTNGPGYLYDNPTIFYAPIGFPVEAPHIDTPAGSTLEMPPAPARTYLYFAIRAAVKRPYEYIYKKLPVLEKIQAKIKNRMVLRGR